MTASASRPESTASTTPCCPGRNASYPKWSLSALRALSRSFTCPSLLCRSRLPDDARIRAACRPDPRRAAAPPPAVRGRFPPALFLSDRHHTASSLKKNARKTHIAGGILRPEPEQNATLAGRNLRPATGQNRLDSLSPFENDSVFVQLNRRFLENLSQIRSGARKIHGIALFLSMTPQPSAASRSGKEAGRRPPWPPSW